VPGELLARKRAGRKENKKAAGGDVEEEEVVGEGEDGDTGVVKAWFREMWESAHFG